MNDKQKLINYVARNGATANPSVIKDMVEEVASDDYEIIDVVDSYLETKNYVESVNGLVADEYGNVNIENVSWNDLTDKPFYETTNDVIIMDKTNLPIGQGITFASLGIEVTPTPGAKVTITINGTSYENTVNGSYVDNPEDGSIYIGNLSLYSYYADTVVDTGETYLLAFNIPYQSFNLVAADSQQTYNTVKVVERQGEIIFIDEKFIPDNIKVPAYTASENGKVLGVVNGALAWVDIPSSAEEATV